MANEWMKVRLGEVARLRKGVSYQGAHLDRPGPRLLGLGTVMSGGGLKLQEARTYGGPIKEWQMIRPGEMLVALTDLTQDGRVLGSPALLPSTAKGDFAVTHHVARVEIIRPDLLNVRYLYYLLRGHNAQVHMRGVATGTTVRAVSTSDAEGLATDLPPVEEQCAIAHVLGTLDDKIELNRRIALTLESMVRALFRSWFVDFEPVRAKSEGRDSGLSRRLVESFPDGFEDSELGKIPKSWKVGTLGDVAQNPRRGIQPYDIASDTPYIALEHMPKRCIALSDWELPKGLESNKFAFRKGEILFGKLRPYFHKVGVAPVDGVCSTDIVVVAPQSPQWSAFVLGLVSSDEFVEYTNAGSTGTKMPRTSWAEMARYAIALPPEGVADVFAKQLQPQIERILATIHESRVLSTLRDILLAKLISGELRLEDSEAIVLGA